MKKGEQKIAEGEIIGGPNIKNSKKKNWLVTIVYFLSLFLIVISYRVAALPATEFPIIVSILLVLATIYVVIISYTSTLSPNQTHYRFATHLLTVCFMYVLPTMTVIIPITNIIVPKTEINKKYEKIIEISYDGYDGVSFQLDADVLHERQFIFAWPYNQVETHVGKIYLGDDLYDISDCIDSDRQDFYNGKTIKCPAEDGLYAKVTLKVDKLDYSVAQSG